MLIHVKDIKGQKFTRRQFNIGYKLFSPQYNFKIYIITCKHLGNFNCYRM